jgi:hypothetical protein
MTDYCGSDGRGYADQEVWERLECGDWTVCCWDEETGLEVVETDEGELLFLVPTDRPAVEPYAVEA